MRAAPDLGAGGPIARDISELTVVIVVLGTAVMVLFVVLLMLALRSRAAEPEGHGSSKASDLLDLSGSSRWFVIGGGVVLPALVIVVVLGWTIKTMRDIPAVPPDDSLVILVTGHQWWWEVVYPDGGVRIQNEVHIPTDRAVEVRLNSSDVIHSFWVPALNGKLDAIPGRTNSLILEADEVAEFSGQCAEFCGLDHAQMVLTVVAHTPADFREWLATAAQQLPDGQDG